MKRVIGIVLALALLSLPVLATSYTNFTDLSFSGSFALGTTELIDSSGNFSLTGTIGVDTTTVSLDGSTSVDLISAGHVDLEATDVRVGYSDHYTKFAVADTTGNLTITHVGGTTDLVTWTAAGGFDLVGAIALDAITASGVVSVDDTTDSSSTVTGSIHTDGGLGVAKTLYVGTGADITGDLAQDGATVVLDGSTSVRGVSAGFTSLESPANRFGVDASVYMQIATTATTGITAITHTGTAPTVTWTANSFDIVGAIALDAITTSSSITMANGEIVNNAADGVVTLTGDDATGVEFQVISADHDTTGDATLVLDADAGGDDADTWKIISQANGNDLSIVNHATEVLNLTTAGILQIDSNLVSDGTVKGTGIIVDDGDADVTVDSDNQTDASAAINIPDFGDATADFLVTNIFKTWLPFAGGLGGEDSDAVGTHGAGLLGGGSIDVTTYDFNDSGAGANDVLCKVYDLGTTAWDDLSEAATLTAAADWAINYQLLPDADAEQIGDAVAIGFDEPFCEVAFNDFSTGNGALATWGGAGGKWQYSTGAGAWSDLTVYDGTDANDQSGGQPFSQTGAVSFAPPSDWAVATYDSEEAYWIQWVFTAAQLTQTPVIDDTNKDEPIIPFPSDALDAPYKCEIVAVRVTNFNATVHDQIIKFVVGNFTDGTFSAELSWAASQISDRFTLASAIACDADDVIGIMVTDDGGSSNNPIWMAEFEVSYED